MSSLAVSLLGNVSNQSVCGWLASGAQTITRCIGRERPLRKPTDVFALIPMYDTGSRHTVNRELSLTGLIAWVSRAVLRFPRGRVAM